MCFSLVDRVVSYGAHCLRTVLIFLWGRWACSSDASYSCPALATLVTPVRMEHHRFNTAYPHNLYAATVGRGSSMPTLSKSMATLLLQMALETRTSYQSSTFSAISAQFKPWTESSFPLKRGSRNGEARNRNRHIRNGRRQNHVRNSSACPQKHCETTRCCRPQSTRDMLRHRQAQVPPAWFWPLMTR